MAQKLNLKIKKSTFEGGEKLMSDDLLDLGLDSEADHMKITFVQYFINSLSTCTLKCFILNVQDNDKTVKYCLCCGCICSAVTVFFWPIYALFFFWYACDSIVHCALCSPRSVTRCAGVSCSASDTVSWRLQSPEKLQLRTDSWCWNRGIIRVAVSFGTSRQRVCR